MHVGVESKFVGHHIDRTIKHIVGSWCRAPHIILCRTLDLHIIAKGRVGTLFYTGRSVEGSLICP